MVTHKRGLAKAISLQNETNSNRIKFFYYKIRNQLINMATYKNYNTGKLDEMLRSYQRLFLKLLLGIHCKRDKDKAMLVYRAVKDYKTKNYDTDAFDDRLKF